MKRTRSQVPWRTRNSVPGADGPKGPGLGLEPRHQLDIQGRGDQLVVMPGIVVLDLAQPVTGRATGAQANHNQAGEALEHLSTGEGHRCGYLVFGAIKLPAWLAVKGEYDTPANGKD
jgi:hypothetical protein